MIKDVTIHKHEQRAGDPWVSNRRKQRVDFIHINTIVLPPLEPQLIRGFSLKILSLLLSLPTRKYKVGCDKRTFTATSLKRICAAPARDQFQQSAKDFYLAFLKIKFFAFPLSFSPTINKTSSGYNFKKSGKAKSKGGFSVGCSF